MPSSNTRSVTGIPSCSSRSVLYVGSHTRTTERALCLLSSWNRTGRQSAPVSTSQHQHQPAGHQLVSRQATRRLLTPQWPAIAPGSQSVHSVRWSACSCSCWVGAHRWSATSPYRPQQRDSPHNARPRERPTLRFSTHCCLKSSVKDFGGTRACKWRSRIRSMRSGLQRLTKVVPCVLIETLVTLPIFEQSQIVSDRFTLCYCLTLKRSHTINMIELKQARSQERSSGGGTAVGRGGMFGP